MIPSLDPPPRRVLVMRPRGLGDVVLASAVIDALGRAIPDAAIDFLSSSAARSLLETDARLDRIFLLAREELRAGRVQGGGTRDAISWMRRARADLVLDLFSNPKTALLTAMSGARWRAGLAKRVRRFAYNIRIPRFRGRPEDDHRWACDVMLDFVRAAGVSWEGNARPSIALTPADRDYAERSLVSLGYGNASRFAAVLPGGSWESKRWSPEGFAAVSRLLAERTRTPTLVVWGPPEEGDARSIAQLAGSATRLAPPSSIREMAAVLARAELLVSTDCLGRHLAIAQGVPTVGVFASTDPRDWTPRSGPHRTVGGPGGPYSDDLRKMPPDEIVKCSLALLDEIGSTPDAALDSTPGRT